jgi:hypothetical protein
MGFLDSFKTTFETREKHPLRDFQTHYFKANLKTTKETLLTIIKKEGWTVETENDRFGELFVRGKKHHLIITMIQTSPQEVAVDIKVQVYQLMGFKKPQKMITFIYQELANQLTLKGTGLHPA